MVHESKPMGSQAQLEALEQLEAARDVIDRALVGDWDLAKAVRWVLSRAVNAACWLPWIDEEQEAA
jgi:hypothetical protein